MEVGTTTITGGIRKFVDRLPGLTAAGANGLGQYIPVAVPDTTTYPGSDYYEIELGQYTEKMHSDLPPTTLRGYRQTNTADPTVSQFHYLGPLIVAQKDRPVRVKFTNTLPTGAGGNLFIPVDTTVMGAGPGPNVSDALRTATTADMLCKPLPDGSIPTDCYTQNRATIHLHGGVTPWISDGTTAPVDHAGRREHRLPEGRQRLQRARHAGPGQAGQPGSRRRVPDVLLHQPAERAADVLPRPRVRHHPPQRLRRRGRRLPAQDQAEQDLINGTNVTGVNPGLARIIPADQIPLVIQDKTFVDATTIDIQDPTWNWGTGAFSTHTDPNGATMLKRAANTGDLWWPHVYMPAQNPYDISGLNAMGRWHYGPWFWPPTTGVALRTGSQPVLRAATAS